MRKKLPILVLLVIVSVSYVHAARHYDFSSYSGSNVLYYRILTTNTVEVTYPYDTNGQNGYYGTTKPLGILEIGSTVNHDGRIYYVVSIGDYAFYNCTMPVSISIPNSVTHIGHAALSGCTGLSSVTIPNSVTSIGDQAFQYCTGLTSISIPNSVTSIGDYVFANCTGLTSVTIPNSVTYIGRWAFEECTGLTSITIPSSVTSIDIYAFNDCNSLSHVNFNATDCSLPWGGVFRYCPNLTSATIGNNVQYIPNFLFYECSRLSSVSISSSVIGIGSLAFSDCTELRSIIIPNSVTSIYNGAFADCSGLTSVNIPNLLDTIDRYTFMNCSSLLSISIPNSVKYIDNRAFSGCTSLSYVNIPESVAVINHNTFYNCTRLTSITIPGSVTMIDSNAFAECTGFTKIYSENPTAPALGTTPFENINPNIPVYIPCGARESYTENWSYFNLFIETPFLVLSENTTHGNVEFIQEPTCETPTAIVRAVPNEGFHFDHWSDGCTQNPYTYMPTAKSDMTLFAYFSPGEDTTGIEEVDGNVRIPNIYADGGKIMVTGAEGVEVCLYNMMGRLLATRKGEGIHFDVPTAGIYLVRIGDRAARKVVVVR